MAEEPEQAPAVEQETPEDAPEPQSEEGTRAEEEGKPESEPAETVDYEKRYNDLRPEYDRSNQLLAAARGDHGPEAQNEALQALGLALEDTQPQEDEYVDPEDEIAQIKEYLAQREQADEQAQFRAQEEQYIDTTVRELEKREGLELSDKEFELVVGTALTNREPDGRPDLEGAMKALKAVQANAQERYLESKKAPKAPTGTAGDRQFDLSTEEGRKEAMVAYMGEGSQE